MMESLFFSLQFMHNEGVRTVCECAFFVCLHVSCAFFCFFLCLKMNFSRK